MEVTVTRALAELKLLEAKIKKKTAQLDVVGTYQKRSPVVRGTNLDRDRYEQTARGQWDSVEQLLERRDKLKAAIIASNASTTVTVQDKTMTVAEAIARKQALPLRIQLVKEAKAQLQVALEDVETARAQLDARVETMLTTNLGTDKKTDPQMWETVAKPFIEQNEVRLLDPLRLEGNLERRYDELISFETEVDFALSEANARTTIEIDNE